MHSRLLNEEDTQNAIWFEFVPFEAKETVTWSVYEKMCRMYTVHCTAINRLNRELLLGDKKEATKLPLQLLTSQQAAILLYDITKSSWYDSYLTTSGLSA